MLTSKQRAYLRGVANDVKATVQIGKLGVTPDVSQAVNEALEANELVKISILDNNMLDAKETAQLLSERTRSDVVVVVGRKFVLYKKSKTKPVIELPKSK